jgi:uncharacterized membrane protein YadS
LLIGMALSGLARRIVFTPGLVWCIKTLLRVSIAILGLRISLADIVGLGPGTVLIVVLAMAATIASSMWLSARMGLGVSYGALRVRPTRCAALPRRSPRQRSSRPMNARAPTSPLP